MISFFELSFEEFCAKMGYKQDATARIIWRTEAVTRFAAIKSSNHYHNGVPCRAFHALEFGEAS
jgi:hypothetical protein